MAGFIFGGNTGIATPEELANRRRWAQTMIRSGTERTPQDPWEGIASIARVLSGNFADYRARQEETKQRGAADSRFSALFKSSATPAASAGGSPTVTPVSYSPEEQTGAPGYRGIAKVMPQSDTGKWLNAQLASDPDLKLSPAAAAGITGNLDLETGGFKHMQEIKPMVPGSRGGYGWAQWTGPRRVQFEAWARQNGLDPASKEANFGFLKHEMLNTPEGKVLASLQGAQDPGQAATIFSDQYLRPGIPHMDRRVAAAQGYASGSPSIQPAGDTQPVRLAQAGGPGLNELLQAYSDPWASEEQKSILQMYIQQEMQKADPLRQLQLEEGKLKIDALKNPPPEYGFEVLPDGRMVRTDKRKGSATPIMQSDQKPTNDMQNYEAYAADERAAGRQPLGRLEYERALKKAGATNINNNMGGEKFGEEFAKGDAKALSDVSQSGLSAQRNIARINRLDELLTRAPQGATAAWKQWAGEYGVNTEGLDNIQSAQALINSLVPEQRPPGSGPMSDADLVLFKQSLPRLINQPGGNKLIINTIRAVAQYDAEGAAIVQKLRRNEIDRATAFDMLQSRVNPLDQLNDLPSVNDIDEELKKRGVQ